MPNEIYQQVFKNGLLSPDDFSKSYVSNYKFLRRSFAALDGVKTSLIVEYAARPYSNKIRVATIMSDYVSCFLGQANEMTIQLQNANEKPVGQITIPNSVLIRLEAEGINVPRMQFNAGFSSFTKDTLEETLQFFRPLVDSGRVFVRPRPVVLSSFGEKVKGQSGRFFWPDPESPVNHWFIRNSDEVIPHMPILLEKNVPEHERRVSQLIVPFIANVPMSDFVKILHDEELLLAEFRVAVRALIEEARANDNSLEVDRIREDRIRPVLDRLERKFESLSKLTKLEIGGAAVGTVVVTLGALSTAGTAAAIGAFLGAAGLAGITSKQLSSALSRKEALRDEPLYLLWRFRRAQIK